MHKEFETSQKPSAMTITVNEALRLKNEISALLHNVQAIARPGVMGLRSARLTYGEQIEDGLKVVNENAIDFEDYKDRYFALLNYCWQWRIF